MLLEHVLMCELTLRGKLVSTNGTLSLGSMDFLASLNKDPDYKRDSSSHFCRTVTASKCINNGGHAEQVESKLSGMGVSRNKAKSI